MKFSFDPSEVLGRGGYGKVFKGFWGDQPVAVKRIELTSDEQEEKSLRELDHENVIKLFHAESDENFR
jgi:serine/threonine protein kinase